MLLSQDFHFPACFRKMGGCCDLQVDVNGEEVFMVDKKTLATYSGRFRKLFGKLTGASRCLKVIFHDFPGGAEGFELMARFCYNNGRIEITPSNIVLLFCVAHFMEMGGDGDGSGRPNILSQTEKSLEGISFWTWSNLVVALKQCQDLLPALNSSSILHKLLDSIIAKLFSPYVTSTYASSSEDLSFRFSSGRSSYSPKTDCSRKTWWVEDLMFLNTDLIEKVVRRMIFQELDHATIFKFLFHFHQSKSIGATRGEKRKITELVIGLLFLLDRSFLSVKGLFKIYQAAMCLRVSKKCVNKLVNLIGSQLDQATIDFLLVPSPRTKKYVYDVSLVLKLMKSFLLEGGDRVSQSRLKSVAKLMDSYLAEVAPDSHLNPSKFEALATMLPHSARESHDRLYHAIDVYFKRRADLFREEKMSICCALNYEKLSTEALKHLAHNSKFPPRRAVEAFATEQLKLRSLFHEAYNLKTLDSLFIDTGKEIRDEKEEGKQIIPLSTKKLDLPTETRKRRADLQSMQWKASELGVCGTMEMKMTGALNLRLSFRGSTRYLPTLFP